MAEDKEHKDQEKEVYKRILHFYFDKRDNRQWYIDRPRVNGDPHGQAPMLWICNALL